MAEQVTMSATSRNVQAAHRRVLGTRLLGPCLARGKALADRFLPSREIPVFAGIAPYFTRKHGLEIGGPSGVFRDRSLLPVYAAAASCDNCNFSGTTLWQGAVAEGMTFRYDRNKKPGRQFIGEGSAMPDIAGGSYDFVIASHVIEHMANPLKGLLEWKRVLRSGGCMLVVCPHKEGTFDHRRPVTPPSHMADDYRHDMDEGDLTHLPEILELHDLARDPEAGSRQQFAARSSKNAENRCLHHHVFITESWIGILDWAGLELLAMAAVRPFHIVAAARKVEDNDSSLSDVHQSNARFMSMDAAWRRDSPFAADRIAGQS